MNKKDMDLGSGRASKKRSGPKDMDLGSGIRPSKKEFNLKKDMDLGSGTRKAKPTNLKKSNGNKPKVVTPKMIKDAGFTTLRDYLNDKRGLTRKDGKKVVKTSTKSSAPKAPPAAPNRGKKKIVSSLKSSRSGIDGPSSSVKKKKAKTGFGSKAMTTKVPKKTRQGITRTPLQAKRKRRSMMGST